MPQPRPEQRKQQKPSAYDLIDTLDNSGLNLGFHHSGPFDAALSRSKTRPDRPSPIGAFSPSAWDPANQVAANGADLSPLRERPNYSSSRGASGGAGLSARAKAALSAGDPSSSSMDPNASSDYLLTGPSSPASSYRGRRNSEGSITLGYPAAATEKERQYMETFGVHGEAYEDFGNSSYSRRDPRVSVYPSDRKSGLSSQTRADRTASIWDIEATLRAGRPVGASAAPPMPVIPDQYLTAPSVSYSDASEGSSKDGTGVKRSKSLISRMRSKKSAQTSPDLSRSPPQGSSSQFASAPSQAYDEDAKLGLSPSGDRKVSSSSAAPVPMYTSTSSSSGYTSSTRPQGRLSPTIAKRPQDLSAPSSRLANMNIRTPPVVSPLDLPTATDYPFPSGMSKSKKYDDLANESATAAILAESSSKESGVGISKSDSSSSSDSMHNSKQYLADTSYNGNSASDRSAAADASFTSNSTLTHPGDYSGSNNISSEEKENEGKPLSRKASLAKRFFKGKKKQT